MKYEQYGQFMKEYQELGHMELVSQSENAKEKVHTHHTVLGESSSTTKLCVVFDVLSNSSYGFSHNNLLMMVLQVQHKLQYVFMWKNF